MNFRIFVTESAERLDLFLSRSTQKSRSFIKAQILKQQVKVNNEIIDKPSFEVSPGDEIEAELKDDANKLIPVSKELDILYEDKDLIVLNKPQGMVVHPAPSHKGDTLVHYLLFHFKDSIGFEGLSELRPGIVHRLDKGTSGCLIVAKNRSALENLSAQFKNREVKKVYKAIVFGKMTGGGVVKNEIGRDQRSRTKISTKTSTGRPSETAWNVTKAFRQFSEVVLYPKTGRTHQLRVHLSELHHPIVGDSTYGGLRYKNNPSYTDEIRSFLDGMEFPFLHAEQIEFTHPVLQTIMAFQAAVPESYQSFLSLIEKNYASELS